MITKQNLDKLVKKYETTEFIKDDPIKFIHKYKQKEDIEIAGFIASLVAYGSRKQFIKKLDELFKIANDEPYNFILNFEPKILGDFNYRFGKPEDFSEIFLILKDLYKDNGGLENLFKYGYEKYKSNEVESIFIPVVDYFYANIKNKVGQGFYHMIPNPRNGGAMKRMCMLLRWFVRSKPVDVGIWKFMPKSDLFIPLDVHVARISREMGLLKRSSNDFKAVIELTENLKKFDANDPAKYDFAIFSYGINQQKQ